MHRIKNWSKIGVLEYFIDLVLGLGDQARLNERLSSQNAIKLISQSILPKWWTGDNKDTYKKYIEFAWKNYAF